jgi:CRISPR-associated endonuclease Csn1
MYEDEFEVLWKAQRQYHPAILTDDLRALLFSIIFHQRPPKTQKFLVGRCQFENSRKRAAKALLEVQHFRILQDINNLKVKIPETRNERPLSPDERKILFNVLNANSAPRYNDALNKQTRDMLDKSGKMTWGKVRKLLGGLHKGEKFNLEEGGKELIGNRTVLAMRAVLREEWDKMPEERQKALLTDLLTIDRKDALIKRLRGSIWNFSAEQAYKLAITEFEPGYSNLSLKAIRKILPHLEDGLNYFLASFAAYDPCHPDKKASIIRLVKEGVEFDKACKIVGYDKPTNLKATDKLGEPPYLRNPVVQRALYETRKVVNAIIHEYGKPATIRIEMARDMKLTKSQKETVDEQNKINRKANEKAAQILFEIGKITRPDPKLAKPDDLLRYRLWEECRGICPYTGKPIGMAMLFSNEINIEHIIPYSRFQVDGYKNKTLCVATFNQLSKQNKTPYEYFAGNNEEYQNVLNRVGRFQKIKRCRIDKKTQKVGWHEIPNPKIYLFEQKEIDTDKFVERQLNDTRYICVEVKKYLQQIGASIEISKGEATAALRHRWNLNRILAEDGSSEKNRADHRHHAIDAIVIALTSGSMFQKLSRLSAQSGVALSERGFRLDNPWQSFYDDVRAKIEAITVSHATNHKISGALHEETAYGYSSNDKCFVYRKPLDVDITLAQILKIRDKYVKEIIIARLEKFESEIRKAIDETMPKKSRYKITDKQAKDLIKKAFGNAGCPLLHKDGKTFIKSVRIMDNTLKSNMLAVKNKSGQEYKYYPFGNNHHIEIIEHTKTGKRDGIVVTTAEAARRARNNKIPIVQKLPPWEKEGIIFGEDWKFVMSLAINDMLLLAKDDIKQYFRVQKISSNTQIFYLSHTAATLDESTSKTPNAFECRKVIVDVLGKIIACKND